MSALALGIIAALCWGFHDICVRFLSQKVPISACLFTVLVVGLIFHLGLIGVTAAPMGIGQEAAIWAAVAGVFFVIATFGLYGAFQRGPVRLVAPLIASYPILSVAWATLNGAEVSAFQWLAVLAIVTGVGVVAALSDPATEDNPPMGRTIAYALIAAVGFAGTFAFGQVAAELSHEMPATLITRVVSVVLAGGVLAAASLPFWPGKAALKWLIAMGCADGVALWCVLSAGPLPNAEYAAVTSSMFGLLTIVLAWIFLRERMALPQWLGCAVAFAGVGYLAL